MKTKYLISACLALAMLAGCSSSASSDSDASSDSVSSSETTAETETPSDDTETAEDDSSSEEATTTVDFKNLQFTIPESWSDTLEEDDADTWYWYPEGGILMAMDLEDYLNLEMDYDEEFGENFIKSWGDQFASCTASDPTTTKVDKYPAFCFTAAVTNKEGTEFDAKVIVFDGKDTSYTLNFLNRTDSDVDNMPEFDEIISSIVVE